MMPSALQTGGSRERIRYVLAESPLGRTAVAATARGVCAIGFADIDGELQAELRERFPKAELVETVLQPAVALRPGATSEDEVAQWLRSAIDFVLRCLRESTAAAAFPLDVRATAFQQRVWQALRRIPCGEQVSYGELARQLGRPTGARAVAGACARNPVALAIPCHRVVGAAGDLAGYRWGIERKRRLLALERGQS